ncbi:hypothetical protein M2337_002395 [Sphingobium sp. B2D3A]|nr:hypothetical protein [Sphingobium sp. B2D3A]
MLQQTGRSFVGEKWEMRAGWFVAIEQDPGCIARERMIEHRPELGRNGGGLGIAEHRAGVNEEPILMGLEHEIDVLDDDPTISAAWGGLDQALDRCTVGGRNMLGRANEQRRAPHLHLHRV